MGLLILCFVSGGGFLYTVIVIVLGGRLLSPSSRVPGGDGWWLRMKLIAALIKCSVYDSWTL